MALPLIMGIGTTLLNAVTSNTRVIFKFFLFLSFIAVLVSFSVWFLSFMSDIYEVIQIATNQFSGGTSSGLLGCALRILGIGEFFNSAFSIFYSAATFWIIAVSYIMTYKLGAKAYNGLFMAVT